MKHNYLVSVFVGGKNVNSYYSENLDDLVTIKALHKDCEICIFDMRTFENFTKEQVEKEVQRSGLRWKKSLEKPRRHDNAINSGNARNGLHFINAPKP